MILLTIAVAAIEPASLVGPSSLELAAAIHAAPQIAGPVDFRTDTIRFLRCRAFDEEPTEYRCSFKAWFTDGRWKRRSAVVALDREEWVLLSPD